MSLTRVTLTRILSCRNSLLPISSPRSMPPPDPQQIHSKKARKLFVSSQLAPHVGAQLDQPFGKDTIDCCFKSEATFLHVLLPIKFSGFWEDADWTVLRQVSKYANQDGLCRSSLFPRGLEALVQWMGGSFTLEHRNHHTILQYVQGKIDQDLFHDSKHIYFVIIPAFCNASDTEETFQAYMKYGNHKTIDQALEKAKRALVKDTARGYALALDPSLVSSTLHRIVK
jgi:hypothetical protein